jgi:hypothetical protein
VSLNAGDWTAEGHLWAIHEQPVSIAQLRAVARILGPDAVAGVEARLTAVRQRLVDRASMEESAIRRAAEARAALAKFDEAVEV